MSYTGSTLTGSGLTNAVTGGVVVGASTWLFAIPVVYQLLQGLGFFGSATDDQETLMNKQYDLQKKLLELQRQWQLADKAKQEAKNTEITATLKPALPFYQSPNTGKVDQVAMNAIMAQMNRSKNWGYPAGMSVQNLGTTGLSGSPAAGSTATPATSATPAANTQAALAAYKQAAASTTTGSPNSKVDCIANCTSQFGSIQNGANTQSLKDCISQCSGG